MSDRSSEPTALDQSALDGRISFVTAAFIIGYGLLALLDRAGAPERLVGATAPYFTLAALAMLGFLLHSMRVSLYYTAGRSVPAEYAGFAGAAIIVGLALPFAARFAGRSWLIGLCGGLLLGAAGAALYFGPLLRKTGAFSLAGLLAARFPGFGPRVAVIVVGGFASALVALAGHQTAVDALVHLTGAGRVFAAFIVGVAILLIAGPGGLFGVIWAAAAAGGVALAGLAWPLLGLAWGKGLPLTIFGNGDGWRAVGETLRSWPVLPPSSGLAADGAVLVAVAAGVVTLAPILAPAVTTRSVGSARRAGFAACVWTLLLVLLVAMTVGASALAFSRSTVGQAPERLPDAVYAASARGLVRICGQKLASPAVARRLCAENGLPAGEPLRPGDVTVVAADFLLAGLPELEGLGASRSGLLASALIALGLVLAASGLQAAATAVGHEALYRMRGETDLTSRRLAITRITLVGITAVGSASSAAALFDARALAMLAIALSAATVAPLLALAFWPRAGDRDAFVALCAGLAGLAVALLVGGAARSIDGVALAAFAGAASALAGATLSALRSPPDYAPGAAFVARALRGDGQLLEPDKGA